ncbi:MAG: Ethanolamine utilization protein EutN [Verrucomicrobiota bacterium]|jgi:microcompartment protein CcmK/EutM
MLLCRVEGNATSTIRHPSLKGWRLLICQPLRENNEPDGLPILSLDALGAGVHDRVLVSSDGRSVQERIGTRHTPARYMTIAILDTGEDGHPKGGVLI